MMNGKMIATTVAGGALLVAGLASACGGGGQTPEKTPSPTPKAATATKAATTSTAVATPTAPGTTVAPEPSPTTAPPAPQATAPVAVPTPVSQPTLAPPPPPPPPPSGEASITIVAKDTKFSPASATLPAGATVTLTLDNQDEGVTHDIIIYAPGGGQVAGTDLATGPVTQTTTFTLDSPGNYAFKCSVHPQQMYGVLKAQ